MIVLFIVIVVLLVGLTAAAAAGRIDVGTVEEPVSTQSFHGLPEETLQPEHLHEVRFDQVLRGYRMSQVDDVIERLTDELRDRDEELRRLRDEESGR